MKKKVKNPQAPPALTPPIAPPSLVETAQNMVSILETFRKGIELGIAMSVEHVKFYEKEKCVSGCTIDAQINPALKEFKKEQIQKIIQPLLLELLDEPDSELKKKLISRLKGMLINAGITTTPTAPSTNAITPTPSN